MVLWWWHTEPGPAILQQCRAQTSLPRRPPIPVLQQLGQLGGGRGPDGRARQQVQHHQAEQREAVVLALCCDVMPVQLLGRAAVFTARRMTEITNVPTLARWRK